MKINTGHRSFCLHREYVGAEALNRRSIQLSGNVMITVSAGALLIERGPERQLIEAGGMAMVREGELELTEVPDPGCTYGEVFYFFFKTEVLRDWSRRDPGAERIALGMIPWPFEVAVTARGLANLLPVLRLGGAPFPGNFEKILTVAINQTSASMYDFLAKAFYLPRLRLNLFMEQHILCDHRRLGDAYPGGAKQLAEDFRIFQGVSVKTWLRKRRMQLSRLWMAHNEAGVKDLPQKFHYEDRENFVKDFRRESRIQAPSLKTGRPWQELDSASRLSMSIPSWLPVEKDLGPFEERIENRPDAVAAEKAETDFWNATSTIGMVCDVIRVNFGPHSHASALGDEFLLHHAA